MTDSVGVESAGRAKSGRAVIGRVLGGAAVVLYPVGVWYGLSQGNPRLAAGMLLAIALPVAIVRLRGRGARAAKTLGFLPFVTVALLALAATLNRAGFMLAVPVAINVALLASFGTTLRRGATPMVERFARLTLTDPSPAQLAWCRLWTVIWCAFFVFNGGTAAALALWADLSWWAAYNGFISYLLSGALMATEWILRRRRFGHS